MSELSKARRKRLASLWTFCYGPQLPDGSRRALPQIRVDDTPGEVRVDGAQAMASAVMEAGGILCGACLTPSPVRYIRTDDPTVARCFQCHDDTLDRE